MSRMSKMEAALLAAILGLILFGQWLIVLLLAHATCGHLLQAS